eukprot:860124-Rhodomonas_salina.1
MDMIKKTPCFAIQTNPNQTTSQGEDVDVCHARHRHCREQWVTIAVVQWAAWQSHLAAFANNASPRCMSGIA